MTQIRIKKARTFPSGEQFFPITHTKAVVDDNGNSVESRLQAMQDEINQAQMAIETDPVFSASPAAGITPNDITEWDGKAEPTTVVNHGTSDTTFSLTPNVLHVWGTVTSLTLTLATPADATIVNEYMFQFTSGTTATTLSLPSSVVWDEDKGTLTVESGYIYQVSILNNVALWARVAV